jgi:hypothetical protein
MHQQSRRMTVFSTTPVEKIFQNKSILADIKFTKIRKWPFIGEMVIAEETSIGIHFSYRNLFFFYQHIMIIIKII